MKAVCIQNGEMFHDFDHHWGKFNDTLTLFSFLPLWAGVSMDAGMKKRMIEDYLLNEKHFNGPCPLPYLAYSDSEYKPDGYWRGRIWPHVTYWMLEALWREGYEKEADSMADRIMGMMAQREEILENYNSSPDMPGGCAPDILWSFATYRLLADRCYRDPVIGKITSK